MKHIISNGLVYICLMMSSQAYAADYTCDKTCLTDITQKYVEGMIRNSVDGVPLALNVRATSNSQEVKVGQGETWQEGITLVNRHTFLDPGTHTSIFFGTIAGKPPEQGKRDWYHYAVRLTVDKESNIAEIEEQSTSAGFQTANKVETPFKEAAIFDVVLPEDERVSADELVAAADAYWSALDSGELDDPLWTPDCQRTEFGSYSTNNAYTHNESVPDYVHKEIVGKSCQWFFDFGPKFHWPTDNRRYYIVDEARGVVVGIGQLHQLNEDAIPGITLFEAFKIINGRIDFLWAPSFNYNLEDSGWPDWDRSK